MTIRDDLAELAALRRAGQLTEEEYLSVRQALLGAVPDAQTATQAPRRCVRRPASDFLAALVPPGLVAAAICGTGLPADLAATAGITLLAAITVARFRASETE